jgi:hydroxymethylbilane synthase
MIKIGTLMAPWAKLFGIFAQREFKRDANLDSQIVYYRSDKDLFDALLLGEIQIAPKGLKDLPTTLPEGINIAALSEREVVANSLFLSIKNKDENNLFSLKRNAKVWVNSEINRAQMQTFRDDLIFEVKELSPMEAIDALRDDAYDACVLTATTINVVGLNMEEFHTVQFSPKEFITEPGQSVAAFLTAEEDIKTRKLMKQIHHKNVALVTNVERQLKKLFNDKDISAYCQHDAGGNFHLWAAALVNGELKRTRLSHSTSFELAERCFEVLNK